MQLPKDIARDLLLYVLTITAIIALMAWLGGGL